MSDKEIIANDILLLDDSNFDAAFYNAYLHFKAIDEENYIESMDLVTSILSKIVDPSKKFTCARLRGVDSFDAFLQRNGFSSINDYETYSEKVLLNYAKYLEQQNKVMQLAR